ncbi:hypothetical protein [Pelagovum pacificum]|uniref:hypothetical protein n=1 Tax=Pelagovum pacificum TaxID=2588711 RepID=UPI001124BE9A|nr:hypothetical protein [Pelagovum pacificum]
MPEPILTWRRISADVGQAEHNGRCYQLLRYRPARGPPVGALSHTLFGLWIGPFLDGAGAHLCARPSARELMACAEWWAAELPPIARDAAPSEDPGGGGTDGKACRHQDNRTAA